LSTYQGVLGRWSDHAAISH